MRGPRMPPSLSVMSHCLHLCIYGRHPQSITIFIPTLLRREAKVLHESLKQVRTVCHSDCPRPLSPWVPLSPTFLNPPAASQSRPLPCPSPLLGCPPLPALPTSHLLTFVKIFAQTNPFPSPSPVAFFKKGCCPPLPEPRIPRALSAQRVFVVLPVNPFPTCRGLSSPFLDVVITAVSPSLPRPER